MSANSKGSTAQFVVTLQVPSGCVKEDMRDYIGDAVKTMKGSFDPYDPRSHLDRNTISVSSAVSGYAMVPVDLLEADGWEFWDTDESADGSAGWAPPRSRAS